MIRRLLRKCIVWIMREDDEEISISTASPSRFRKNRAISKDDVELRSNSMTFNLYAANGGSVIETHLYVEKDDRLQHTLYIIPEGTSFGTALDEIVTLERLKSWH